MIIGVSGLCIDSLGRRRSAGSGKGEAAKRLIDKHKFVEIAWADPMKRFLQEVYEFTDEQLWGTPEDKARPDPRYPLPAGGFLTPRHAMQSLGTGWGRACFDDTWVNYGIRTAKALLDNISVSYAPKYGLRKAATPLERLTRDAMVGVVFTDVRYPNEFSAVHKAGGKMVRITRTLQVPFDLESMDHDHSSETSLLDYADAAFHYVIDNFGTVDTLYKMVDTMVDVFKGKIRPYDAAQEDVPPFMRKKQQVL